MNKKFNLNEFRFLILFIVVFSVGFLVFDNAYAFNQLHNNIGASSTGFNNGHIWLEKFTNLGQNQTQNLTLELNSNGTGNFTSNVGKNDGNSVGFTATVYVDKFVIPVGVNVTTVQVHTANAAGNIRLKVYDADGAGNQPSTELEDVASQAATLSGIYVLPTPVQVRSSGIIWIGFELDNNPAAIEYTTSVDSTITSRSPAHTYGSGPNPFGTPNPTTDHPFITVTYEIKNVYFIIKAYQDDGVGGGPHTLVAESTRQAVGNCCPPFPKNYSIIATVPNDGNLWVGEENSISNIGVGGPQLIFNNNGVTPLSNFTIATHAFGSGPSTITTENSLDGMYMNLWFGTPTTSNVSFKMFLNDNSAMITTGQVLAIQSGSTKQTATVNGTGWANFSALPQGTYNFTFIDSAQTFVVYKLLNKVISSNVVQNISTWEMPKNCISATVGFQSDFIVQVNDTDGTHIVNVTPLTCPTQTQLKFNFTFNGNGQSSTVYNSLARITVATQAYETNPTNFTVNGVVVPTIFTNGNNILSNPFTVGAGNVNTTLQFVVNFATTQSTSSSSSGGSIGGSAPPPTNCFGGVIDPITNTCLAGSNNPPSTIQTIPPIIQIDPTSQSNGTIVVNCSGSGSVTITNVDLGTNPLGITVSSLPQTIQCGNIVPTTCPIGTNLVNGQCIGQTTCPIGSILSNGVCAASLTCPTGTTLTNGQCIAPVTCSGGAIPVNGQCSNGIPVVIPPTPSSCGISNPVACITGSAATTPAVLSGTTSDGKSVSINTSITTTQNPELNNVSLVIITLIMIGVIGGIIWRYAIRKESGKIKRSNGRNSEIQKFNRKINKSLS